MHLGQWQISTFLLRYDNISNNKNSSKNHYKDKDESNTHTLSRMVKNDKIIGDF